MPSLDHVHIYERVGARKNNVNPRFRCINPDCTHYAMKDMIKGKRAQCECGNTFLLNWEELQLKRPKCARCATGKRKDLWEEKNKRRNIFKELQAEKQELID